MVEKMVVDKSVQMAKSAEKSVESLVKRAWSILDSSAPKERPSEFLSQPAIRAIQGHEA